MSSYDAWSQLFSLNPDHPQTPMLSAQELQEELALWSNAQFQPEPSGDEPAAKGVGHLADSAAAHENSSAWAFLDMVRAQQQQHTRQLPSHIPAGQPPSAQADPLGFIMNSAAASDILSAITSPTTPHQPAQWAQIPQQNPAGPGALSAVPLLPLAPLPSAVAATKVVSIAPAPAHYHHAPIVPKGDAASFEQAGPPHKTLTKAKSAARTAQSPEPADDSADAIGSTSDAGRGRAAEDDKRRRNTAASARFRVKKKLKEQALERTAREMTAKAEALERRVNELETETRWLKSLITERDPDLLGSVSCPCHHPDGLDDPPAAKKMRL